MHFFLVALELEFLAQRLTEQIEVITLHGKTAALRRRLGSECADDQMAAGSQCPAKVLPVAFPILRFRKKMKNGTVVPEFERVFRQIDPGDISA